MEGQCTKGEQDASVNVFHLDWVDLFKCIELKCSFKATLRDVFSSYMRNKYFRIMKKTVILLVMSLFISCEQNLLEADALGANADIVGTWVEEGYEDDVLILNRSENLDPSKYGFTIHDDGSFIERKNAGWCATPPIYYDNFEGTWEAVSDSLLEVTVGYWGGTMTYQIRVVTLDQEYLAIRYLYAQDRALSR